MKYLLDTNICIYIVKRKPAEVFQRFNLFDPGDICISSITYAELQYGVHKSSNPTRNEQALIQFVTPLEILDFDYKAAREYGYVRSGLEKEGTPIGPLDTLIAAHCISLDLVLVTNNLKEFQRIPRLKIENWVN